MEAIARRRNRRSECSFGAWARETEGAGPVDQGAWAIQLLRGRDWKKIARSLIDTGPSLELDEKTR